jgi:AcrR family transcriptional regulator
VTDSPSRGGAGEPSPGPAARGRPRDPATDRLILAATFRLLFELGYPGLSIEAVAAAAGVGKTTIYRRYTNKRELVVAALRSATEIAPGPPELATRAALSHLIRQAVGALLRADGIRILATLLAEADRDPQLLEVFRENLIEPRRGLILAVLRRAIERGEVRADVDLDVVTEMIIGAVMAHRVRLGELPDEAWVEGLLDAAWAAVRVPGELAESTELGETER